MKIKPPKVDSYDSYSISGVSVTESVFHTDRLSVSVLEFVDDSVNPIRLFIDGHPSDLNPTFMSTVEAKTLAKLLLKHADRHERRLRAAKKRKKK